MSSGGRGAPRGGPSSFRGGLSNRGGSGGPSRGGGNFNRGGPGGPGGGRPGGGRPGADRGMKRGPGGPGGRKPMGGKGGFKKGGGAKAVIEAHRFEGVFLSRSSKGDMVCTLNIVPGSTVYGEKKIIIEGATPEEKKEYRQWNPYRSKLCAAISSGIKNIYIKPGSKVLYLGAASGTTVSHVSDLVGPTGTVYAVEMAARPGRELLEVAKTRTNIIPIIEDARYPAKYRMLVPMVDVLFADVAQRAQAQIFAINAAQFLKNGGNFVISIKASCIDSTAAPSAVFVRVREELIEQQFKPMEQITLEPYERDHAIVTGIYRPGKKEKKEDASSSNH